MPTGQRVRGSIMICVWSEVEKSLFINGHLKKTSNSKIWKFLLFWKQLYGDAPDSNGILPIFTDSANLISSFCYRLMFSKQIWKAQNGKFWKSYSRRCPRINWTAHLWDPSPLRLWVWGQWQWQQCCAVLVQPPQRVKTAGFQAFSQLQRFILNLSFSWKKIFSMR